MISKQFLRTAAVAESGEIEQLSDYVVDRRASKSFEKRKGRPYQSFQGAAPPAPSDGPKKRPTPYHFLRTDMVLLLGPSGGKLLSRTWSKYHLHSEERNPEKLRPALLKLFSVAARIAAPRGVGQALKRLVADFERLYFPIVTDPAMEERRKSARRFALLSALQSGQGSHLLHGVLGDTPSGADIKACNIETLPSKHIERDPTVARRQFLFESAYRAKSWSDAYRHARYLNRSETVNTDRKAFSRRLTNVFAEMMEDGCHGAKKKQALTDLAICSDQNLSARLNYALKASFGTNLGCRPGELETLLIGLLPPSDPWWRPAISRVYRHLPVSNRWMDDLRKLWQQEKNLRGLCRVIFSILRYPKYRAEAALLRHHLPSVWHDYSYDALPHTLKKIKCEVQNWFKLLPPVPDCTHRSPGTAAALPPELWAHLVKVCGVLETSPPCQCVTNMQYRPVEIRHQGSHKSFSFSPDFLHFSTEEKKVLLARALFRNATGLDQLETRATSLNSPAAILERATAYAEWEAHLPDPLWETGKVHPEYQDVLIALEEMYWNTEDENYRRFATLVQRQAWCPLFDRESDLFAASFSDLVNTSHALVKAELWRRELVEQTEREGLLSLRHKLHDASALALRLQNLWINAADKLQLQRRSPDEVLC